MLNCNVNSFYGVSSFLPRRVPPLNITSQQTQIAMPNILTIPREIRDEIYKWGLLDTLASCESSPLQRGRKRVAYDAANPETH